MRRKRYAPVQQTAEEYISGLEKKYGIKISLVDFTNEKQSDAYVFREPGREQFSSCFQYR